VNRDKNIDTARGIACILLVLYHVVGGNAESGLRLEPGSAWRAVNEALGFVRMPLFTFLSGVVYALRPVAPGGGARFTSGKLKRLLLPFIFVSLLFAVVQKLTPGANSQLAWAEIPFVLVWPYGHMWFIAALMLVFAVVGALDYWGALDRPLPVLALFVAACVLFELRHGAAGVLAWNRAFYLLPFFTAGVMLKRFGWRWALLCVLLALVALRWPIAIGVAFGVTLLAATPTVPLLAWIGGYSYSIYLFHVFGSAASRIALERIGVTSLPLLVVSGTLAGLVVPILLHLALERVPFVSRALLGVRHARRPGEPEPAVPAAAAHSARR
jgi:fucose 4-O-acetylase-like acetyltransferase